MVSKARSIISISIVSHGQGALLSNLLKDLAALGDAPILEVILTKNIPEQLSFVENDFPYRLTIIENESPKGFGANHNSAFARAEGVWFCVVNPDIRVQDNPFTKLISDIDRQNAGVIAPAVLSPGGNVEDSVRRFPTLLLLVGKLLGLSDGRYSYSIGQDTFRADWVGGMFMLFRANDFRRVGGFDEGFFLYYEDVDICVRLWKAGRVVAACPGAHVVHDARRASRRSLRYMRWHVDAMTRYFAKHWLRLPKTDLS